MKLGRAAKSHHKQTLVYDVLISNQKLSSDTAPPGQDETRKRPLKSRGRKS